ncbi:hypothetical protein KL86PLE_120080 [uncultured Pleomorphomonas sp.]|uniref:Uncharacterized protein n=1 Tax=uncultured Pleomorphomonas sp. TaxID=442121 RepID=A0A212L879_9HYPH|nr:hypothetical protein KL86PLE_120080 [uncultured Pleomorphomonas sp.]
MEAAGDRLDHPQAGRTSGGHGLRRPTGVRGLRSRRLRACPKFYWGGHPASNPVLVRVATFALGAL